MGYRRLSLRDVDAQGGLYAPQPDLRRADPPVLPPVPRYNLREWVREAKEPLSSRPFVRLDAVVIGFAAVALVWRYYLEAVR